MLVILTILNLFFAPMDHDIHVSICDIKDKSDKGKVELSVKIFYDDLLNAVGLKVGEELPENYTSADELIIEFISRNIKVSINGEEKEMKYIESISYPPAVWTTMEIDHQSTINDITIENTILLNLFDDQTNMVNIKLAGEKKKAFALNHKKTLVNIKR